jgi:hypothetical protein
MDDTKKARAYADLMRLVNGYQISQAVHVAASLGVADHLHDTACSIEELASLTAWGWPHLPLKRRTRGRARGKLCRLRSWCLRL